jgi:hypothetical protein
MDAGSGHTSEYFIFFRIEARARDFFCYEKYEDGRGYIFFRFGKGTGDFFGVWKYGDGRDYIFFVIFYKFVRNT